MKLKDRIAIVTGASNGIGRAIALGLAREGANVAVVDIDLDEGGKVVDTIQALGREAMVVKVDVTNTDKVNLMAKSVLDKFGKIDILVNNAGGSARGKSTFFFKSTEAVWDNILALNLKGLFNCTRAVIEHMMERKKGKIINISSCSGLVGMTGLVVYSTAKAGVIGFTMALAKEVASYGIQVNSVAPGPTATRAMEAFPDSNAFAKLTGLGRLAHPEEIAAMVVFLATEDANFITGQVMPVCGLRNRGVEPYTIG